jgi:hypothetical protein
MGKKSKKKSKPKPSAGVENNIHHHQRQHELSTNRERIITEQLGSLTLDAVEKALADGAACYFCLDEGPDETGKPVVRDCSCRGNDAGCAHLSCMIKYAQQKSKSLVGKDGFHKPWQICLSCKQPFKGKLALDMTSACLSFVESTFGHPRQSLDDKFCVMNAIRLRIETIVYFQREFLTDNLLKEVVLIDEGKMLSKKLLSMIEQITKEEEMTYLQLKELRCDLEAMTYNYLASLNADCLAECISYYEKARDICHLYASRKDDAKAIQISIDALRANSTVCNDSRATDTIMKSTKYVYEHSIKTRGLTSAHTIHYG